jgi:hypothetical protein
MPATPQPFATTSGGPVAPVSARLRDYALLSGACGGAVGACSAASFDTPIAYGFCWVGATWAAAAAAFVGVRHALLQDRWEDDREGVSGVAGAVVGGAGAAVRLGRGVALQGAEALEGEAGDLGGLDGAELGGAQTAVEERALAPRLARAQLVDALPSGEDAERAREHDDAEVARLALVANRSAGGERAGREIRRKHSELIRPQRREQRTTESWL